MVVLTADLSPWIRIERTADSFEKSLPFRAPSQEDPAPPTPAVALKFDPPMPYMELSNAPWLQAVQQRIVASVPPTGYSIEQDGTWVSQEVANAAVQFFGSFPETFSIEPYLYCAPSGDLVAEFDGARNKLTCLVSPDSVTVYSYSSIDEKLTPRKLPRADWSAEQIGLLITQ
jgi:hypothetical protein